MKQALIIIIGIILIIPVTLFLLSTIGTLLGLIMQPQIFIPLILVIALIALPGIVIGLIAKK